MSEFRGDFFKFWERMLKLWCKMYNFKDEFQICGLIFRILRWISELWGIKFSIPSLNVRIARCKFEHTLTECWYSINCRCLFCMQYNWFDYTFSPSYSPRTDASLCLVWRTQRNVICVCVCSRCVQVHVCLSLYNCVCVSVLCWLSKCPSDVGLAAASLWQ